MLLIFCMLENYILPVFQNITQIVKNKDPKRRMMELSCSKKSAALLRRIKTKNNNDLYCLNCPHSFRTKKQTCIAYKVCQHKDFCSVAVPSEDTRKVYINKYQKSVKSAFMIYADLE